MQTAPDPSAVQSLAVVQGAPTEPVAVDVPQTPLVHVAFVPVQAAHALPPKPQAPMFCCAYVTQLPLLQQPPEQLLESHVGVFEVQTPLMHVSSVPHATHAAPLMPHWVLL